MATSRTYLLTGIFVATLVVFVFLLQGVRTEAASGTPITGYAWSDTIGWIDFNCSNSNVCGTNNFGLSIDGTGVISGYAWSDNIGWISANSADLSGCPSGTCSANISSTTITGWFKALAANGNGWDGWISLSGANYGVNVAADGTFSGYAWGSDVVGWTDFSLARIANCFAGQIWNGTSCTCPAGQTWNGNSCVSQCTGGQTWNGTACICAAGTSCNCPSGQSWNGTSCVSFCTGGQTWNGTTCACPAGQSLSGGVCTGSCVDSFFCQGSNLMHQDTSCVNTLSQNCSFGCSSGTCLTAPTAAINFTVTPLLVRKGETVQITWSTTDATACTVTSTNGSSWSGTSGSQTSLPIQAQTIFNISCTSTSGATVSQSATVNIIPVFCEPGTPGC